MKTAFVCLLVVLCSIAVSAEFYEVDVNGPIYEPEEALQALRDLGLQANQEKRITNWPPVNEDAVCAGVSASSCLNLFQDTARSTWFVRNCCTSQKLPIMQFKNVDNVNLYEDCIAAGKQKSLWWMEDNLHLTPEVVSVKHC